MFGLSLSLARAQLQNSVKPGSCMSSEFLDSTVLSCVLCPGNTNPTSDRKYFGAILTILELGCECKPGFIVDPLSLNEFFPKCIKCVEGASTSDRSQCMTCPGGTTTQGAWGSDCMCSRN